MNYGNIGWKNGLSPGRYQAIIKTNAGLLLIGTLGTNFSEIIIKIQPHSYIKMSFETLAILSRPQCVKNIQGKINNIPGNQIAMRLLVNVKKIKKCLMQNAFILWAPSAMFATMLKHW